MVTVNKYRTATGERVATFRVEVSLTAAELGYLAADYAGLLFGAEDDNLDDADLTDTGLRDAIRDAVFNGLTTASYRAGDNNTEGVAAELTDRIVARHFDGRRHREDPE